MENDSNIVGPVKEKLEEESTQKIVAKLNSKIIWE